MQTPVLFLSLLVLLLFSTPSHGADIIAPDCCELSNECLHRADGGPIILVPIPKAVPFSGLWCGSNHPSFCVYVSRLGSFCMSMPRFLAHEGLYRRFCRSEQAEQVSDDRCPIAGPSPTASVTASPTASQSMTPSGSPSESMIPSSSPSASMIPSSSPSSSMIPSTTPSTSPTPSVSFSPRPSPTPSIAPYCCNLSQGCVDKATTVGYWTKWKSESQSDRVLCANTIEDGACMLELGRQWYCMSMYDFKTYVWSYVGFCPQGELPGSDVDECPL